MSKALQSAIILAVVGVVGLFLAFLIPTWGLSITTLVVLIHSIGFWITTREAGKSSVRIFGIVHTFWLLFGSVGALYLLLFESALPHVLLIVLTGILLVTYDYHMLRFLMIPAERSRTVMLGSSWFAQGYTIYVTTVSLFGLVLFAQLSMVWVLLLTAVVSASLVYPYLLFVEKRMAHRLVSVGVITVITTEIVWVLSLFPIGYSASALLAATVFLVALKILEHIAGEPVRDKMKKVLYGGASIILILILLLVRWL